MLKPKKDCIAKLSFCSASREDLCAAVQYLSDHFITYVGPFVIKSGIAAFKVSDYLLTADELVSLHKSGLLTQEGLAKFVKELDHADERFVLEGQR
jgi:hypothetical protein